METEVERYSHYSVEEVKQGYREEGNEITCLLCGTYFIKGTNYKIDGVLYDAVAAVKKHIEKEHQSVKSYLLGMPSDYLGISDLQLQLLNFFSTGISDKEVADYLCISASTVRNHRFKLRERERQSKLFLALMELLQEDEHSTNFKINHEVDDKEKKKIIEKYMTESGKLKQYPTYNKSQKIILEKILERFSLGKKYTEEQILETLSHIYKDYPMLKEELMNYDYLRKSNRADIYWIREYSEK